MRLKEKGLKIALKNMTEINKNVNFITNNNSVFNIYIKCMLRILLF